MRDAYLRRLSWGPVSSKSSDKNPRMRGFGTRYRHSRSWLSRKTRETGWVAWVALVGVLVTVGYNWLKPWLPGGDPGSVEHQVEQIVRQNFEDGLVVGTAQQMGMRGFGRDSYLVISSDRAQAALSRQGLQLAQMKSDRVQVFENRDDRLGLRFQLQPKSTKRDGSDEFQMPYYFVLLHAGRVGASNAEQVVGYFQAEVGNTELVFPVAIWWDAATAKFRVRALDAHPALLRGIPKTEAFAYGERHRYDKPLALKNESGKLVVRGYQTTLFSTTVDEKEGAFIYGFPIDGECHLCGRTLRLNAVSLNYPRYSACYWDGKESLVYRLPKNYGDLRHVREGIRRFSDHHNLECGG